MIIKSVNKIKYFCILLNNFSWLFFKYIKNKPLILKFKLWYNPFFKINKKFENYKNMSHHKIKTLEVLDNKVDVDRINSYAINYITH